MGEADPISKEGDICKKGRGGGEGEMSSSGNKGVGNYEAVPNM